MDSEIVNLAKKTDFNLLKELAPVVWTLCGVLMFWIWNFFNKNIEDKDKIATTAIDKLIDGVGDLTSSVNKLTTKLSVLEVIAKQHASDIKEIKGDVKELQKR